MFCKRTICIMYVLLMLLSYEKVSNDNCKAPSNGDDAMFKAKVQLHCKSADDDVNALYDDDDNWMNDEPDSYYGSDWAGSGSVSLRLEYGAVYSVRRFCFFYTVTLTFCSKYCRKSIEKCIQRWSGPSLHKTQNIYKEFLLFVPFFLSFYYF